MESQGVVRFWNDEHGWGVIDSPLTSGGCWAHFSVVEVAGYRSLTPGEEVELEWEAVEQDGYGFRAISVRTAESENHS
ncbi:cold shock domain-containing protein [Arthrobacter sp. FW305-123]|nr:cold shock domain-containing protein [Arthrobacter sp. FW305-123]